jgi:hypothetical protein
LLAEEKTIQVQAKKKATPSGSNLQNLLLVIVFVAVFAGVFMLLRGARGNEAEYEFQGIRVLCTACGGDAQAALHSVVAKPRVIMREELTAGNSSKNTMVAIVASQIAANFRALNKTFYAFGVVDGKPEIACENYTDYCSNESIQVAIGECNCMRIDAARGIVRVEGTEEWFRENNYARVMTVAGIIGGALK